MTIGELRAALAKIDAMHDSEIVSVWLPGSRVDLSGTIFMGPESGPFPKEYLIEGNVRDGSALLQ